MQSRTIIDLNLICPLCGIRAAKHDGRKHTSREHIPPKSIFVNKSEISGLITVPSCEECNAGTSLLDEKFKFSLSVFIGTDTPIKQAFWQSCRRTLAHKPMWRQKIISSAGNVLVPIGETGRFGYHVPIEAEPIKIVCTKIIKGLHYHITTEILPFDTAVTLYFLQQGQKKLPIEREEFQTYGKLIQKCGNQFEAIHVIPSGEGAAYHSAWLLRFYGEDFLIATVVPKEVQEKIISELNDKKIA